MNEPADESRAVVGPFYARLAAAIRAVDPDHILFFDGNTYSTEFDFFGEPLENAVYALHDYVPAGLGRADHYEPGGGGGEVPGALGLRRRTGTPIYVGEFAPIYSGDDDDRRRRADPGRPARALPAPRRRLRHVDVQGSRPPGAHLRAARLALRRAGGGLRGQEGAARRRPVGQHRPGEPGGHPADPGPRGARGAGLRPLSVGPFRLRAHAACSTSRSRSRSCRSTPSCSAGARTASSTRWRTRSRWPTAGSARPCATSSRALNAGRRPARAGRAAGHRGAGARAAARGRGARAHRGGRRLPQRLPLHDRRPALPAARRRGPRGLPGWWRPWARASSASRPATGSRCCGGRAAGAAGTAWPGSPCMCELGKVQATTGGLPDDGTTRLRLDGREVHHLMGVVLLRRAGRGVGEVGRPCARRRAVAGSPPSRAAPSSPASAPCSTCRASAPGARCS